jgi:hypothetical protein
MKFITTLVGIVAVLGTARKAFGDFFVIKKFADGSQQTTTMSANDDHQIEVNQFVRSV